MYIDTNILMRYLLNDIPEQTDIAAEIIADGAQIYPEVIPEAVYVLSKIYEIPRKAVSDTLIAILDDISVERKEQIKKTLKLFRETKLDYIDCLHLAGYSLSGEDFLSFDKKLMHKKKSLSNTP